MSATKDDLNYLLFWAINDDGFLDGLLKDPQKKANKKGIELSSKQVAFFKKHAAAIRQMNRVADLALKTVKRSRVATIIGTDPE